MQSNRKGPDFTLILKMSYADLKTYLITELIPQETDEFNRQYLTGISKWSEEIHHLHDLQLALKHYIDCLALQKKLKELYAHINAHSYLHKLYYDEWKLLADEYFNIEVLLTKKSFSQAAPQIKLLDEKLIKFKNKLILPHFKHSQLDNAPLYLDREVNGSISQAVLTALHLFKNYHETSSIFRLNWRHHSKPAKRLERELQKIITNDADPILKIDQAIDAIFKEMNHVAHKHKMSQADINHSTFFRRAFYALENLDQERNNRGSHIGLPRSPSAIFQLRRTEFNVKLREEEQALANKERDARQASARKLALFKQKLKALEEAEKKGTPGGQYSPQLFNAVQVDPDRVIHVKELDEGLLRIFSMGSKV